MSVGHWYGLAGALLLYVAGMASATLISMGSWFSLLTLIPVISGGMLIVEGIERGDS